jgi:antitoxin component YwqK of YwqJK toxin-antitoxin module
MRKKTFYDKEMILPKTIISYDYTGSIKNGQCIEYYENGVISFEGNFVDGIQQGISIKRFKNNNISNLNHYKNDKLEELQREYYENGQLKSECFYMNGVKTGIEIEYSKDGEIKEEKIFKNGNFIKNKKDAIIKIEESIKKEKIKSVSSKTLEDLTLLLKDITTVKNIDIINWECVYPYPQYFS